jgi:hypothetical protein
MQEQLHHELRSMVYESLPEPGNENDMIAVYRRVNNLGHLAGWILACRHQHPINPEYVGAETRLELIEMCRLVNNQLSWA